MTTGCELSIVTGASSGIGRAVAERPMPDDIAETISAIARMPLHVRVDAIERLPEKGVP